MTTEHQETIARIEQTFLGYEDHGVLTATLSLTYGGSGQGAGQHVLDGPYDHETKERRPNAACGAFVAGVIRACGVDSWEKVKGRTIIAIRESGYGGMVRGIKPLPTEPGEGFLFTDIQMWVDA